MSKEGWHIFVNDVLMDEAEQCVPLLKQRDPKTRSRVGSWVIGGWIS